MFWGLLHSLEIERKAIYKKTTVWCCLLFPFIFFFSCHSVSFRASIYQDIEQK